MTTPLEPYGHRAPGEGKLIAADQIRRPMAWHLRTVIGDALGAAKRVSAYLGWKPVQLGRRPPLVQNDRAWRRPEDPVARSACRTCRSGACGRQRDVMASLAPSATKEPAKTRRIQVITRGRETTWVLTAAANTP